VSSPESTRTGHVEYPTGSHSSLRLEVVRSGAALPRREVSQSRFRELSGLRTRAAYSCPELGWNLHARGEQNSIPDGCNFPQWGDSAANPSEG